jgi:hypothetical protein
MIYGNVCKVKRLLCWVWLKHCASVGTQDEAQCLGKYHKIKLLNTLKSMGARVWSHVSCFLWPIMMELKGGSFVNWKGIEVIKSNDFANLCH